MRLLVVHDKHGDRYFDISDENKFDTACKAILSERFHCGYYDVDDEPVVEEYDLESVPLSLHTDAKRRHARQVQEHEYWEEKVDFLNRVKSVLNSDECKIWREYPESYWILLERADFEYEDISVHFTEEQ